MKIQPDTYLVACGYAPMPKRRGLAGWKEDLVTEKQKAELDKYGIAYSRVKYKGQASMLLSIIFKRHNKSLASPKQIQVLLENGYNINKVKYLTIKGASKIISKFSLV